MKKFKNDYFKEILMRTYWGVIGSVLKDNNYNQNLRASYTNS